MSKMYYRDKAISLAIILLTYFLLLIPFPLYMAIQEHSWFYVSLFSVSFITFVFFIRFLWKRLS